MFYMWQQDTSKMATMIGKVIDLGVPSNEAFECLLFDNQLSGEHINNNCYRIKLFFVVFDLQTVMWI